MGEKGGLNLYGFVGNDGVNFFDLIGLQSSDSGMFSGILKMKKSIGQAIENFKKMEFIYNPALFDSDCDANCEVQYQSCLSEVETYAEKYEASIDSAYNRISIIIDGAYKYYKPNCNKIKDVIKKIACKNLVNEVNSLVTSALTRANTVVTSTLQVAILKANLSCKTYMRICVEKQKEKKCCNKNE